MSFETQQYCEEQKTISDEDLLTSYINGDRESFTKIMRKYEKPLLSYITGYLGSRDDATDVCQEAWLKIFLKARKFDTQKSFKSWLYTIATNTAIDFHRRKCKSTGKQFDLYTLHIEGVTPEELLATFIGADREGEPIDQLTLQELKHRILSAIDLLEKPEQQQVLLCILEGKTYQEMATELELPSGTVRSRLHAARRELEDILKKDADIREILSRSHPAIRHTLRLTSPSPSCDP